MRMRKRRQMMFREPERAMLETAMKVRLRLMLSVEPEFEKRDDERCYELPMPWASVNGPLRWAMFWIDPKGIGAHIAFDFMNKPPDLPGINRSSGKWNHYLWPAGPPRDLNPLELSQLFERLDEILREIRPAK
jgi:hypothetical protein